MTRIHSKLTLQLILTLLALLGYIYIYIYIYMNYSKQKLCIGRNRLYDHMCGRYTNSTTNVLSVWVEGVYVIFIY